MIKVKYAQPYPLPMNVREVPVEEEMKTAYMEYAMSVIVGRALPDVRDGLKPVHRRILYGMYELGVTHDKPHKKSARIVGEVMGKYHPHGGNAIYDALVRMAQDFSLRYPLVDGQGNFGSVDGDSAAAMRYTEARLSRIAEEMLADIEKETVDFVPNFDGTLREPVVLPSRFPNLLVNGSSGIAVGMSTNMPPHNLREVVDAILHYIDNRDCSVDDLLQFIKGPDFPTGGTVIGYDGLLEAYRTGKGKFRVRGLVEVETSGKTTYLVIRQIPYETKKSEIVREIAAAVRSDRIPEITDLKDESDREGMRVTIRLKADANPDIVINKLYEHTSLEVTFGVKCLVLVDGVPRLLNLKGLIEEYVKHRMDVVIRRAQYELRKSEERAHIVEGLLRALDQIDEVIETIRSSRNVAEARGRLMAGFGFTEVQASAILQMRLQKLTGLEREALHEEMERLREKIEYLRRVLSSEEMRYSIIKDELREIIKKYGDERRTVILKESIQRRSIEELISDEPYVFVLTSGGYIKRVAPDEYRRQRRGGKGVTTDGGTVDDTIKDVFSATTHTKILVFTNYGKVYMLRGYEVPPGGRRTRGKHIKSLLPRMDEGEEVICVLPVRDFSTGYLFFTTRHGRVKRTPLSEYSSPRSTGIIAIHLRKGDMLVDVRKVGEAGEILIITRKGMGIRFGVDEVRPMGRTAAGVIGIRLWGGDEVLTTIPISRPHVLTITENGYGKRTPVGEFRRTHRGAHGVKAHRLTERTGDLAGALNVSGEEELLVVTRSGQTIRFHSSTVPVHSRATMGVRVIKVEEDDMVASITEIISEV